MMHATLITPDLRDLTCETAQRGTSQGRWLLPAAGLLGFSVLSTWRRIGKTGTMTGTCIGLNA